MHIRCPLRYCEAFTKSFQPHSPRWISNKNTIFYQAVKICDRIRCVKDMYIFMDIKYKVLQQAHLLVCVFLKYLCWQLVFSPILSYCDSKQTKDITCITCFSMKWMFYILFQKYLFFNALYFCRFHGTRQYYHLLFSIHTLFVDCKKKKKKHMYYRVVTTRCLYNPLHLDMYAYIFRH